MIDYLNNVESDYHGIRRTLQTAEMKNHVILRHLCRFSPEVTNLAVTLVLFKLHLA